MQRLRLPRLKSSRSERRCRKIRRSLAHRVVTSLTRLISVRIPMQEQLEEQLVILQARVKKLTASRDTLIRDQGAAERKLEEAQEKLRELGIETQGLTSKQLEVEATA